MQAVFAEIGSLQVEFESLLLGYELCLICSEGVIHAQRHTHRPACALPPSLAERGLKMGPKAGEESG